MVPHGLRVLRAPACAAGRYEPPDCVTWQLAHSLGRYAPRLGYHVGCTSVHISALLAASGSGLMTVSLVRCGFLRPKYCRVMNNGTSSLRSDVPMMMSCSACRTSASKQAPRQD